MRRQRKHISGPRPEYGAGNEYIERKLQQIGEYEQVFDSISLGDNLFDLDHYELAEEKYLEVKKKAASIYFDDGRR